MKTQKIVAMNIGTLAKYTRCEKVSAKKYRVSTKNGSKSSWLVDAANIKFIK